MDNNLDKIALDLYGKIQTRFTDIKMGDENAAVLSKKADIPRARFFEFEYTEDGEPLGTITITLDIDDGVVVQVSGDLVDDDSNTTHHNAYKFIRSFRKFAKNRLLNFDVQNIGKSNLDKRDYQFQAKPKEQPMMESKMFGTSRISYQDLGEARLIVKHTQPINPELAAGRTMHIECIYIENADGERFKYPYKHLPGARALAEHIKHGGIPYDDIGKHITKLSEELASLRKFKGYVSRQSQISEAMGDVTSRVIDRIDTIKKEIVSLQRPAYYQQFAESFTAKEDQVIPENVMNDWIDRLTVRTFNEDMRSVFPFLYKIVDESELPVCELSSDYFLDEKAPKGWEGTVKAMKKHKEIDNPWALAHSMKNKGYTSHKKESFDPEIAFESFINRIMLEDKDELFSPNKDAQKVAIDKLNKILEKELHGGPDGINAIESLAGLIDDTDFLDSLKDIDPDLDLRPLIQQYVTQADPSVAIQLKFGDGELGGTDLPPVANGAPAPDSEPAPGGAAPAEPDLGGGMPPMGGGMPPMGGELPPEGGEVPPEGEPGAEGAPPAPGSEVPPPAAPGSEVPPPAPVSEELQQLRKLSGLHEDEAEDDTWKYNVDGKEAYTPDQLRYIRDPHSMEVANARARLQDARTSGATPAQIAKYEKEFIALSGGHAADLDQQERMYQASTEKLRETEEVDHKKAKLTAMFIKAKASGATLETMFAEGMTIRDALRESGLTPCETGFGECDTDEEESDDQLDGKTQILNSIEGFWNKEEENFTIGGARVKIKIIKSFKDGDYSNASEDDVKYILTKVNRLDPSDDDREQSDVLRLAGVQDQDSAFANDDDDQTISMLMKELQWHGGRRRHDSIDKHKIRKTMRNNYEQNFKNRAGKFR